MPAINWLAGMARSYKSQLDYLPGQPSLNIAQFLFAYRMLHAVFMPFHRIAQFQQRIA